MGKKMRHPGIAPTKFPTPRKNTQIIIHYICSTAAAVAAETINPFCLYM
jgi:hypothetical protein